jgi:hypothetical protein
MDFEPSPSDILHEINQIQTDIMSLQNDFMYFRSILEEFLPMARKAAAIKAMNPAALVKEAVSKRARSRSITPGEDGSGREG